MPLLADDSHVTTTPSPHPVSGMCTSRCSRGADETPCAISPAPVPIPISPTPSTKRVTEPRTAVLQSVMDGMPDPICICTPCVRLWVLYASRWQAMGPTNVKYVAWLAGMCVRACVHKYRCFLIRVTTHAPGPYHGCFAGSELSCLYPPCPSTTLSSHHLVVTL